MKTLFLICALLSLTAAKIIDINDVMDKYFADIDESLLKYNITTINFGPSKWQGGSQNGGIFFAINSIYRTANCTADVEDTSVTVEYHAGLRLLALAIPLLTIGNDNMTDHAKIGVNSLVTIITAINSTSECNVTVDKLEIEALDNVMNYASLPDYDGKDISEDIKEFVLPPFNQFLDQVRPWLSKELTQSYCHAQSRINNPLIVDVFPVLLKHHPLFKNSVF